MENPRWRAGASGSKRSSSDRSLTENPQNTQYALDPIDIFAPGVDDAEKDLRRRLARAQATGSARATRSQSDDARCLWWQVAQIASAKTFARASKDDLMDILRAISMMNCAANIFERIESDFR